MEVGDVIDNKYRLLELLGSGGYGQVFEAEHVTLPHRYAFKCLLPNRAANEEALNRFFQEATTAASIGSEHIVKVIDCGLGDSPGSSPYLVMERLEGETLDGLLEREGPLEPSRAVRLTLQVCEALSQAHGKGIIHRDLKPANLFLTEHDGSDWVVVLDFGIAKVMDAQTLTKSNVPLGTLVYMAPEQASNAAHVDHRCDIYSLGAILSELLTGERIMFGQFLRGKPRQLRPDISEGLERALLRAVAFSAADRFDSMDELAQALAPFEGSGMSTTPSVEVVPPPRASAIPPTSPSVVPPPRSPSVIPPTEAQLPAKVELLLAPDIKAEMVLLRRGTFTMGSPKTEVGRYPDELQHQVTLTEPFLLWSTPVTQAQFEAVMGFNLSGFRTSGRDAPVERVTWFEAVAFCNKLSLMHGLTEAYQLSDVQGQPGSEGFVAVVGWRGPSCAGYRLPTEAEWEYACRAGSEAATPEGDLARGLIKQESLNPVLDPIAWFAGNSEGRTHPVGVRAPNEWGLSDMIGNVLEWVWDRRGSYESGPVTDPMGSETGWDRIIRGGSWESPGRSCRSAYRSSHATEARSPIIGFRPARSLVGG